MSHDKELWTLGAIFGLLLILFVGITNAANWTMSQDGKYVSWSNANAIINCTAVSNELINQWQICDFTWLGASSLTLNASFVFNVNEATPKKAYIWQNSAHTLYHDVSTPINHSIIVTPSSIATTNASCYWGQGAIKRNLTFVNGSNTTSQVYCFDSFQNLSNGSYVLWSVWNDMVSTPYTSWYNDWVDISSAFDLSQFGAYKIATAQGTWTSGETKRLKILYDTPVGTSGKFDIYFHTGSAAQAVADPSRIKLKLDPWWNATFSYKVNATLTNWTCNVATCVQPVYVALNKSLTNGSDMRIVDSTETTQLSFWRQESDTNPVLAWNYSNASGYVWVSASNTTSVIWIYYNASGVSDVSSISGVALAGCGDDFNAASFNTSLWQNTGSYTVNQNGNGTMDYSVGSWSTSYGLYCKFNSTSTNARVVAKFNNNNGCSGDCRTGTSFNKTASTETYRMVEYQANDQTMMMPMGTVNGSGSCAINTTGCWHYSSGTWNWGATKFSQWVFNTNDALNITGGLIVRQAGYYPFNTQTANSKMEARPYLGASKGTVDWIIMGTVPNGYTSANQADPIATMGIQEAAATTTLTFVSQSPANGSIFNYSLVNYSWVLNMSGVSLTLCNLSVNGSVTANIVCTNSTANCSQTATTNEGISSWNITCWNGTTSTTSNTSIITIDLTAPNISIQQPTGFKNSTNVSFNYTASDVNTITCAYSLNGAAYATLASCANTTLLGVEGLNNLTLRVNDSAGNHNTNTTTFTVDTINPSVVINTPTNSTYNTTSITMNVTSSDLHLSVCQYSFNDPYQVYACNTTVSLLAMEGVQVLLLYANDTAGNINRTNVTFFVDSIAPVVSIESPANGSIQTDLNISLNFTVDATAVSCWFTLSDVPGMNYSLPGCLNSTFLGPVSGSHTLTVYANDSVGNIGSYAVVFATSYVYGVNVSVPVNGSVYSGGEVEFWFTPWGFASTDTNCTLYIDGVAGTNGSCTTNDVCVVHANVSYTNGSYEEHNWSVTCVYSTQSASAGNFTLVSVPSSFGATLQSARYYIKANFNSFFSYIPIFVALAIGITLMSLGISMGLFIGGFMGVLVAYALEALSWNVTFALGFFILVGLIIGVWGVVKTK